jgi:hypothetical protein
MNDLEHQLQSVRLAAPSETLDHRMAAAFSAAADSSAGGARCPQRASERPSEFSDQRVEDNALHLPSPVSGREQTAAARPSYRRISLFALLAGLGATAVAAGLILFATRPTPTLPGPSQSAVVYRLEPTGLMRQFLTEIPASQRSLPRFTVGVGASAFPPSTAKSNPSS